MQRWVKVKYKNYFFFLIFKNEGGAHPYIYIKTKSFIKSKTRTPVKVAIRHNDFHLIIMEILSLDGVAYDTQ